ncbi:rRNA maturation RNase YbeY [Luteitalea sp.]|jgi:probable rRNA maturation factor|uniref:rRNA maturation RNase YbeY n=1 Tax=Luteitalea sp. TaxID=2004800 RepID=UPI0037C7F5B7
MDADPPTLDITVCTRDGRPVRVPGLARWLAATAPARARGSVTVVLVGDTAMRRLNREWRDKDYATDVLSFPADDDGPRVRGQQRHLGDIVIATGVATRQAREAGHAYGTELKVLALHGLLHLLGYDHETDEGQMRRVEARLRRKGGLAAGLIERESRA